VAGGSLNAPILQLRVGIPPAQLIAQAGGSRDEGNLRPTFQVQIGWKTAARLTSPSGQGPGRKVKIQLGTYFAKIAAVPSVQGQEQEQIVPGNRDFLSAWHFRGMRSPGLK